MDYSRIYAEFITDRRLIEPRLKRSGQYVERHHVIPRSLGGGNEAENLIALKPECHLFAHLLLAKIHGGKLWVAVHAMCHLANSGLREKRALGKRALFGYARRAVAKYHSDIFRGPGGPQADKAIHVLYHFDGRAVRGNRFELEFQTGVPRQQISAVLRGKKKNAHGWYSKQHNPRGATRGALIAEAIRSDDTVMLHHFDGRVWSGMRVNFAEEFGRKLDFQTEGGSVAGWHRTAGDAAQYRMRLVSKAQAAAASRGTILGPMNPNADNATYRFVVIETGETVEVTKWEAKQKFGISSSGLCALFNGRQTKTGGIALAH